MSPKPAAELIREAAERLKAAGVPDALHDAKRLMAKALAESTRQSVPLEMRLISDAEQDRFDGFIARRVRREPLQHITQSVTLMEADLKVDHRALIPRDDTFDLLLEASRRLFDRRRDALTIADLGTGSGVLLAEGLYQFKNAKGVAVEASPEAMSLAEENFTRLKLMDRVSLFRGSWNDWHGWEDCDLILSNPPYIRSDVISTLESEVKDYEPLMALDGGSDGLDAYREIIGLGARQMKPGALLILEIGFDQKQAVSDLLNAAKFTDLSHRQDMSGNDRVVAARKT